MLIKKGRFKEGWPLFEHGLQVSAAEPQRWQRSLKKPFTPAEVPFWRGEELKGKRLLLLGEQGIGDSMMFATLIPRLQKEGAQIALFPGDRLISIYRRSLPDIKVLSQKTFSKGIGKHLTLIFKFLWGPSVNTDSLKFLTMDHGANCSRPTQFRPLNFVSGTATVDPWWESAGKEVEERTGFPRNR